MGRVVIRVFPYWGVFGDVSAEMKVSQSAAGLSFGSAGGTHYKWYMPPRRTQRDAGAAPQSPDMVQIHHQR